MILIAHRGNLNGPNKKLENSPEYIMSAIKKGYYVELDLWFINDKLYLGHDTPDYEITIDFLLNIKNKLFCHCKNIQALRLIVGKFPEIECFFHDNDDVVLTSKNKLWTFPGKELTPLSICVMPERSKQIPKNCYGICSDFVIKYKN